MQLRGTLLVLAFFFWAGTAHGQQPALASPPASAQSWTIYSPGGRHGAEYVWLDEQGRRWSRQTYSMRGFDSDIDQVLTLDGNGQLRRAIIRGTTPQGDAAENFENVDGRAVWRSAVDEGDALAGDRFYLPFNGSMDALTALARALIASPNNELEIFPSGRARIERLAEITVRNDGGEERAVTAWAISGLAWYPVVLWFSGDDFFASVEALSFAPPGWENALEPLQVAQNVALARRAQAVARRLGHRAEGPIAFDNVRLFDADAMRFRSRMTVVVENGLVTTVGPAGRVRIPEGARVIVGAGRTLLPGLWDSHLHFFDDAMGPLLLAGGVTSIRDPGNDPGQLEDRMRRIREGEMLGPQVFPSLLIDGPGPRAAQVARLASTIDEALAHVRYAHEHGYVGVKLYGSIDRTLVAPIAREAHRLGLRVSGHLPAGMRPHEAIDAGYDELTHFYFTLMEAMPDDVVRQSNGMMRLFGPAQHGADIDLDAPPMSPLIRELRTRNIVVDPTINLIERLLLPLPGELAAAYVPYQGALPPQIERGLRAGALQPPEGLTRGRIQQSSQRMIAAIAELHRLGVTIVAGTDGIGLELVRELELYVQSGLTPAEALATATIVPARVIGWDDRTGSIAPGKLAELFLVEGNPERDMGDLRRVEWVMRDGRLMNAQELRDELGLVRLAARRD